MQINVRVTTMDAELEFAIQQSTTGKQLFDQVKEKKKGAVLTKMMGVFDWNGLNMVGILKFILMFTGRGRARSVATGSAKVGCPLRCCCAADLPPSPSDPTHVLNCSHV